MKLYLVTISTYGEDEYVGSYVFSDRQEAEECKRAFDALHKEAGREFDRVILAEEEANPDWRADLESDREAFIG